MPRDFENLRAGEFECASDPTDHLPNGGYNCIAWAFGKKDKWWWPVDESGAFWPEELEKEPVGQETMPNFVKAFQMEGYVLCRNGRLQSGIEKIAIYADSEGQPTHAARSLESGVWTSKIGNGEDIEHESLSSLEGAMYGKAKVYLQRRRDDRPFLRDRVRTFIKRLLGGA